MISVCLKRFHLALILFFLAVPTSFAEEQTVELKIGSLTALADYVVPDGADIKQGVVLVTHGTMAHKDMELINTLQSALAELGVPSLAHTLTLGQDKRTGMYACDIVHDHLSQNAVKEIDIWANWLKEKGAGPITVLGHSRGGAQVASYAAQKNTKADKLALLAATTSGYLDRQKASFKSRHKEELSTYVDKAKTLVEKGEAAKEIAMPGFLHCPAGKALASSVLSYYGNADASATQYLENLTKPILVIAGSADKVVPDLADEVKPMAEANKLTLEVIEDADHFFLDFYAEDAAEKIASFATSK